MNQEDVLKVCRACKKEKPVSEYCRHRLCKGGINPNCKACEKEKKQKFISENREVYLQWKKDDYERNKERCHKLSTKWRKSEKGIKFRKKLRKQRIDTLYPPYVREKLIQRGFTPEQINAHPELITTLTEIIKINRLCKTSQS